MSAGTVISGGFPGRVAQEVQPNQKCGGCLHYDGQAGRTGACTIGLRPWLCGDGGAQEVGYAPLVRGAGTYLPDMNHHGAQAREVETQFVSDLYGAGSTRPVLVKQVTLGEEHVHFVKSMIDQHSRVQKSQCRLCSMQGTHGVAPPNVGYQACTCEPIQAETVAKALVGRMSNALRSATDVGDLAEWVREVAKAGFRLPIPKRARSLGPDGTGRVVDARRRAELRALNRPSKSGTLSDQVKIDGNGGHLRPVEKGTFYHPMGRYDVTPAGGGQHHVDFSPRSGGPQVRVGTFPSPGSARHEAIKHGERLASGSGKLTPSTAAPTRQIKAKKDNAPSVGSDVGKSDGSALTPKTSHFKASHGSYRIDHHADHAMVHYKPKEGVAAPAQSARMKSGDHAVKMSKIHAFVNDHDPGLSHATLGRDHVKFHDHETGTAHEVTSMGQARDHLGY
jgi:hypothetical protein